MNHMLKYLLKDATGILGAFVAWWAIAVLVGLLMYSIWPPTGNQFVAGVSLKSQNVPGNVLGFILALYAFRKVTMDCTSRQE